MKKICNKCNICSISQLEHKSLFKRDLYIDHCHNTNKVRGILCHNCNLALGNFKDNIEFLSKAIKYLQDKKL